MIGQFSSRATRASESRRTRLARSCVSLPSGSCGNARVELVGDAHRARRRRGTRAARCGPGRGWCVSARSSSRASPKLCPSSATGLSSSPRSRCTVRPGRTAALPCRRRRLLVAFARDLEVLRPGSVDVVDRGAVVEGRRAAGVCAVGAIRSIAVLAVRNSRNDGMSFIAKSASTTITNKTPISPRLRPCCFVPIGFLPIAPSLAERPEAPEFVQVEPDEERLADDVLVRHEAPAAVARVVPVVAHHEVWPGTVHARPLVL